jgi:flavin reductase (DIM6/NTAB) family NADH-FMN oxidoreductase RutF
MLFDFKQQTSPLDRYKLMSQTVIPRPIAWVVTENEGVVNVAPFSYFTPLSSDPASLLISVGHKSDGTPKDTLANLRKYRKCTICMVEEDDLEKMHYSSKSLSHDESEAERFDIETEQEFDGFPPRISSASVAYFCELNQEVDLGAQSKTIPLILNVDHLYVSDVLLSDKEHLSIELRTVARIGKQYAFLGEEVEAPHIP